MRQVYQNSYISNYYNMGNVAVNVQPVAEPKYKVDKKRKQVNQKIKTTQSVKKQIVEKSQMLDAPYLVFLTVAIIISFVLCVNYVECNAQLTSSLRRISTLENQLFALEEENRTEAARIDARVNLVDVKERAMNEMGMVYPEKGQIYFYKQETNNYVTKYADIKQ